MLGYILPELPLAFYEIVVWANMFEKGGAE